MTNFKPNTPILGFDDSGFQLFNPNWQVIPVYGVISKGQDLIEGILYTEIKKDSMKSTDIILKMIKESKHYQHLRIIMHMGLTIGGFGVLDIEKLYNGLDIPIIVVLKKLPNYDKIKEVLFDNFEDGEERWRLLNILDKPQKIPKIPIYLQYKGIDFEKATDIVKNSTKVGHIPEPLRISDMIGNANYHYISQRT